MQKIRKNQENRIGTKLEKHQNMKESISLRNALLLAGILVAMVLAFLLLSGNATFTAEIPRPKIPVSDVTKIGQGLIDKVISFL